MPDRYKPAIGLDYVRMRAEQRANLAVAQMQNLWQMNVPQVNVPQVVANNYLGGIIRINGVDYLEPDIAYLAGDEQRGQFTVDAARREATERALELAISLWPEQEDIIRDRAMICVKSPSRPVVWACSVHSALLYRLNPLSVSEMCITTGYTGWVEGQNFYEQPAVLDEVIAIALTLSTPSGEQYALGNYPNDVRIGGRTLYDPISPMLLAHITRLLAG